MLSMFEVIVAIVTGAAVTIAILCEPHRQKLLFGISSRGEDNDGTSTEKSKAGIYSPVPPVADMLAVNESWSDIGQLNAARYPQTPQS